MDKWDDGRLDASIFAIQALKHYGYLKQDFFEFTGEWTRLRRDKRLKTLREEAKATKDDTEIHAALAAFLAVAVVAAVLIDRYSGALIFSIPLIVCCVAAGRSYRRLQFLKKRIAANVKERLCA